MFYLDFIYSVTNLAEGIIDRTAYAQLLNAAIQGKTLTQKEMKTLKSAVHYEEIYNRVTSDPDIVGRTEATMLMNAGVNAVKEIFDKYSSSNSNVDSDSVKGYNTSRGDANELYNFEGNRGGNGETQGYSDTVGTEKNLKELGEKRKGRSDEEHHKILRKLDEERGYL